MFVDREKGGRRGVGQRGERSERGGERGSERGGRGERGREGRRGTEIERGRERGGEREREERVSERVSERETVGWANLWTISCLMVQGQRGVTSPPVTRVCSQHGRTAGFDLLFSGPRHGCE